MCHACANVCKWVRMMNQLGRAQGEFYGQNLEQGRKDKAKEEFKASHYALG